MIPSRDGAAAAQGGPGRAISAQRQQPVRVANASAFSKEGGMMQWNQRVSQLVNREA